MLNRRALSAIFLSGFWFTASAGFAQFASNRYTLILEDPPVASQFTSKTAMRSARAGDYRQQIEARQQALRAELAARKIQVTGSVSTLLNAVFVVAPADRLAELKNLPGVKAVVPQRRYRLRLNRRTAGRRGRSTANAFRRWMNTI